MVDGAAELHAEPDEVALPASFTATTFIHVRT
jgi:hypothetical protein